MSFLARGIKLQSHQALDLFPSNDLIIGRMSASNSNRLEEGLAAGLAITRNPTYEDVASPRSLTCTTRPKPTCILRTRQSTRPTKSSANRPQAQQRRVQFSDVVAGTIVDSLADLSAEEKRCVWYCVSIDYTYMYILPAVFLGVTTDMTLISYMLSPFLLCDRHV